MRPLEVAMNPDWIGNGQNRKYEELLNQKVELWKKQELQNRGINLDWWAEAQLKSRWKEDSNEKESFYLPNKEFDNLLLTAEGQYIVQFPIRYLYGG